MRNVGYTLIGCLAIGTPFCGTQASAASLVVSAGKVSVNTGEGFRTIRLPTAVGAGTAVMVSPGGRADIVYDNGCRQIVSGGVVAVVASNPPSCTPRASLGANKCGLKDTGPECAAADPEAVSHDHLILGAIVAGGGVAAAIALSHDHDKPASP